MAAAYAVVAWVLLQLVNNLVPIFELPPWAARGVVLLLIVGFPITILIVWMRELAPADGATGRAVTGKLDWFLAAALVVVIALVSYDRFAPAPATTTTQPASTADGTPTTGVISIAVLPFVNLSSDKEQEFFSDGMTEEITSALAKVKDLQVVGRTSAFEFKGQNKDLRAIGQALGATNILEGSVRKEGNQIRVTAQLIRADTGRHIWTENYDRELKSVFAIQDDIAKAIAGALQVPLGLKPGETLAASRGIDPEAYQLYLRAKALLRARTLDKPLTEPIGSLEQVVARNPDYAPAWALLAQAYAQEPQFGTVYRQGSVEELRRAVDAALPKAEAAALRAIESDPRNADGFSNLAMTRSMRGRFVEADDLFKQALKLDAFNPDALHFYSSHLAAVGRLKEAVAMREQLRSLEPLVPVFNSNTARFLWVVGQTEAALAMAEASPPDSGNRSTDLARIYTSVGRYGDAAGVLLSAPAERYPPGASKAAAQLLRMAPVPSARQDSPYLGALDFVYLYVGAPERALEFAEHNLAAGYQVTPPYPYLYHPSYAPVRKTERFKALVRKSGLLDYWRARGWPDVCRPAGADDFVCE